MDFIIVQERDSGANVALMVGNICSIRNPIYAHARGADIRMTNGDMFKVNQNIQDIKVLLSGV